MSQEDEKKQEEVCDWPPEQCYPKEMFINQKSADVYLCTSCGMVARDACEMTCPEHENEESESEDESEEDSPVEKFQIFGEKCLLKHLKQNGNKCPLTSHENAKHQKSKQMKKSVRRLQVRCPRSVAHAKKESVLSEEGEIER